MDKRSKTPPIEFKYSPRTEAQRVLFVCSSLTYNYNHPTIQHSFYINNKSYVIPKPPQNPPSNIVYMPDIPYNNIPNFWETISQTEPHIPFTKTPELEQPISKLIEYNETKLEETKNKLQKTLNKKFKLFWEQLSLIFPKQVQWVDKIIIYPTLYGSISSFEQMPRQDRTMHIYFRYKTPTEDIFRSILFSIIRTDLEKLHSKSWFNVNKTIDFILKNTSLKNIVDIPKTPNLSKQLSMYQMGKYAEEMRQFLSSLNVEQFIPKSLKLKQNSIYYKGKPINSIFGEKESKLLKILLKNRNNIIPTEYLIDILYPNDYEATEWRITKLVQRTRQKLHQQGLPKNTIQTIRGVGYLVI